MDRLLTALAGRIARSPQRIVGIGLALTLLAGLAAAAWLGFKTARIELVGAELPFARRVLEIEDEFGDMGAIVVAVRGEDRGVQRRFAGELAAAVAARPDRFRGVFYRVAPEDLGGEALLFLTPAQLRAFDGRLARLLPKLRQGGLVGCLSAFDAELRHRLETGEREGADGAGWSATLGGVVETLLGDSARVLGGTPVARTPLDEITGWDTEGYIWTGDGTLILLVDFREEARDGELDPKAGSISALRQLIETLRPRFPSLQIGLTGKPVLDVDEMHTYQADSLRAGVAALVLVTLLIVVGFRRLVGPALIGLCLAMSVVLTLGLAAVWPGHLNLMAAVFVVVVIGLGVDFGIHLVSRYDEARASGLARPEALGAALRHTGPAIVAGALTTAGAFFVALGTEFRGLQEFGVIAGLGVLAALAVMLTVLPALVMWLDRDGEQAGVAPGGAAFRAIDRTNQRHPGKVLLVVLALSLIAIALIPRVRYDANLLRLQDPNLPSVQLERQLLEDEQLTTWFLAHATQDLTELAAVTSRLKTLEGVRTESVLDRLPAGQAARLPLVRTAQERIARALTREPPRLERGPLAEALEVLLDGLELALDEAVAGGEQEAAKALGKLVTRCEAALELAQGQGALPAAALDYDRRLREGLTGRLRRMSSPLAEALTPQRLPPALRDRLVGAKGSYLLRIYSDGDDLWEPSHAARFIARVRTQLPEVTGNPILMHESSRLMASSYRQAGVYALGVVVLFLLLHFRSVPYALLALASLLVGGLWTLGAMAALGIALNPANLVAFPLLLGIGIDTSVHVIHRAREGGPRAPLAATSLGRALVFSGLTSVASFGSLMLADHPGTASIGSTISVGVLCCVVAGLHLPAALLRIIGAGESRLSD